jgi:DHA2 family multidrug resistance protein
MISKWRSIRRTIPCSSSPELTVTDSVLPQAFRGIGQQFAVPPIVTLTLGSLPPERLKLAFGLFNLMRDLGGAIGIAICSTILNDRTNLHFYHLAEHLTASNDATMALLQGIGANFTGWSGDEVLGESGALKQLWLLTFREALTLTFADIFLFHMVCFLITTAMVPLMRKVASPKAPSADAH